jgi:hypothetical protein
MMERTLFRIEGGPGTRIVSLASYLEAAAVERAEVEANAWIKSLRHARVEGQSFRDRFTWQGDSLWWFAELYLHRLGIISGLLKTIAALETLVAHERPERLTWEHGDRLARGLAPQVARRAGIHYVGPNRFGRESVELLALYRRSTAFALGSALGRRTPDHAGTPPQPAIAAFVHTAFWNELQNKDRLNKAPIPGSPLARETYIGPVLTALAERLPSEDLALVGVGPRKSFKARRWSDRVRRSPRRTHLSGRVTPIQDFGTGRPLRDRLRSWRTQAAARRVLVNAPDLRRRAVFGGYDAWPIVREQLLGVGLLQFPWSVQAMEHVGRALDVLRPRVAVTYAEAGGWGRALVLEARRRSIPVAGLQHGFIYRHWINYLHEPDEMVASAANPADRGYPRPDLTLLYDRMASDHLEQAGRFPPEALVVTGSSRLDALVATVRRMTPEDVRLLRQSLGLDTSQHLVLVASKFVQIRAAFDQLVSSVAAMPNIRLIVKCHPAEGREPYLKVARGRPNVSIAPAQADLARLLAAARLVVTVNSTVAIDAMVLGVPSLVLSLPGNLSPFVEAGAMIGAADEDIGPALESLLYDEGRRDQLLRAGHAFMARHGIRSDGQAARRSADVLVRLAAPRTLSM